MLNFAPSHFMTQRKRKKERQWFWIFLLSSPFGYFYFVW